MASKNSVPIWESMIHSECQMEASSDLEIGASVSKANCLCCPQYLVYGFLDDLVGPDEICTGGGVQQGGSSSAADGNGDTGQVGVWGLGGFMVHGSQVQFRAGSLVVLPAHLQFFRRLWAVSVKVVIEAVPTFRVFIGWWSVVVAMRDMVAGRLVSLPAQVGGRLSSAPWSSPSIVTGYGYQVCCLVLHSLDLIAG